MMTLAMDKNAQTLLSCMEQVVMEWAFLSLEYLGEPGAKPAKLPLERQVTLKGDAGEAVLVVRGSFGLGLELARSVRGLPSSTLQAGEASFGELCNLLAEEWRRRQSAELGAEWRINGNAPSSPEAWPKRLSQGAVIATVRGLALEVLLWLPQEATA